MADELKIKISVEAAQAKDALAQAQAASRGMASEISHLQSEIKAFTAIKIQNELDGFKAGAKDAAREIRQFQVQLSETQATKLTLDDSIRNLKNLEREASESGKSLKRLGDEGSASVRKLSTEAHGSSRIMREGFITASSEIIESWGVDGDIANEIGRMLEKLPPQAKIALVAVAAAFIAGVAAVAAIVLATKEMIDVAEKVGTKSKDDFEKFSKSAKDAGIEVTALDRAMSQELTRSVDIVKSATDGLFLVLIRETGPELIGLLRQAAETLRAMQPLAIAVGEIMAGSFNLANASLKAFTDNAALTGAAIADMLSLSPIRIARGAAQLLGLTERIAENLAVAQKAAAEFKPPEATFDVKGKTVDREAARERAEAAINRMLRKMREDQTIALRDIDALRFATDAFVDQLDAKINLRKGFLAFLDGQQKAFNAAIKSGIEAARDLRRTQFELTDLQIERLNTFAGNELIAIQARAERERQAAIDRTEAIRQQIQEELEANAIEVGDDAKTQQIKLQNQRLLNELLEEEQRRHKAAIEAIDRGEKVEKEQATPGSFRNRFGGASADALDEAGEKLQGFAALVAGFKARIAGEFKALAQSSQTPLQALGGTISQMGIALAQSGFAALVAGRSISQALRQAAAAGIAAIAQLAAVEAIKNVGYALNAMGYTIFTGDPRGALAASHYWGAAAAWGGIALGAAVGAAALGRSGASAGGGALGQQLTGTRQDDSTRSTEERFKFSDRDRFGRETGNVIVTVNIKADTEQQIASVEKALVSSYRREGAAKQIIQNEVNGIGFTTG